MCKGCGTKIVQAILFVVNFLVWVTGVILIGVGAYLLVEAEKWNVLFGDENTLRAVAGFMLGVGVIIMFVGFCGCCGACKKSGCLLKIYFSMVLLVIILEVIAGILAFVYKDEVLEVLSENIDKLLNEYTGEDKNVPTETIDALQREFKCCGSESFADWAGKNYTEGEGVAVPLSCCVDELNVLCNAGTPGNPTTPGDVYSDGCLTKFQDYVENNYLTVGGVCIGLLVFEILALIFACCLIRSAEDEEKGL